MCGIVGLVPRTATDPELLGRLVRGMADSIVHRGPDDEGYFVTPHVALGSRRLSIIDVAGSHQPIRSGDGSKALVFNGEIYNYRKIREELLAAERSFKTEGDSEVVLGAVERWGREGIRRLEGMFAFAIWDEVQQRLLLARDWLGQKSIYFTEMELGFAFASEIKALLTLPSLSRELDLEGLWDYMSLRYLPAEKTFFAGISKMSAGHWLEVGATTRASDRYWTPRYEPKSRLGEARIIDELDELMRDVVEEHLMSEVPLGAFLSGGIDSSLVVAYAARAAGQPLRTFSVGVDVADQSELPWARIVAERYATHHHEEVVAADLAALAPSMVATMEEPLDPLAAGVSLVSQVASEHVTVALGGDGGDELFAGYDRYIGQRLAELYAYLPKTLRRGLLRPLFRMIPEDFGYKSLATRLRWLDEMSELDGVERYAQSAAFLRFPHDQKVRLFAENHLAELEKQRSEALIESWFNDGSAEALVDRMLHTDCMTRLADHQLPIVDRMSMQYSLEVRNPFLDRRIAEFAMRIPPELMLKSRRIKYVTRKLGERYLPRDLIYREKQGFGFPLALWFRGELRSLLQQLVAESRLVKAGVFRREEMHRLVSEHVEGRIDHNYRLWLLFTLELWYRHFVLLEPVEALREWVERARRGEPGP